MNRKHDLRSLMPALLANLAGMLALALFLLAGGNSADTVVLIGAVWAFVFIVYMWARGYQRKKYLDKLLLMTEQLEERYLIADLMMEPKRADDQVFYRILKLAEKSMLEHGEMNSFVVSMTGNLGVVLGVSMTMSGGRWGSNWSDVVTKYQSIYPNEAGNFASQLLPSNLYNQIPLYRAVIQTFVLLMAYLLLLALTSKFCAIT